MHQSSVPIGGADKQSVEILNAALLGPRSSAYHITNHSKKQYYVRLKHLVEIGLVEKQGSI
jgi:hypothetical protein